LQLFLGNSGGASMNRASASFGPGNNASTGAVAGKSSAVGAGVMNAAAAMTSSDARTETLTSSYQKPFSAATTGSALSVPQATNPSKRLSEEVPALNSAAMGLLKPAFRASRG